MTAMQAQEPLTILIAEDSAADRLLLSTIVRLHRERNWIPICGKR